ncbi:hypothetical protein QBC46DRAFT_317219 [Diplogelasinospora grovesii]|uniref:Zn(2)-C6 fungal-type domain-containing protein n=1 Tax=Diplogelasinospora grovesii TaxID=303347 RepID=A0AAN6N5T3_9PEZI|nr:hypothetical protein QBC46DRAFT_317219 [Diplogelasinospora grovesii]
MAAKRADCAPKLRSTCDRCAMLKVRCGKQKPRCERCEAANAPCAYGPSSSSTDIWGPTALAATQSAPQELLGQAPFDFSAPMEFQNPLTGLEWDELMPSADGADLGGWYARFMDVDRDGKDSEEAVTDEGVGFTMPLDGSSSSAHHQPLGSCRANPSPTPTPSNNSPDRSQDGASANCQCSSLAFTVLQDMYHAEFRCRLTTTASDDGSNSSNSSNSGAITPATGGTSANTCSLPRSDEIVKMNRVAVQHMEQLLSCDCAACARDPTLLFLMTALSSKLLAWYRAVFTVVTRQSQSVLDPELSGMDDGDLLDVGFVTPIQVGEFRLDFDSEQRMKSQFLLCEVQRLGQVLDLFGARATSRMQHDDLAKASRKLPISAVYQFLTASLNQLTTAMKEYCVS